MNLNYFYGKKRPMTAISEIPYKNLAQMLLNRIEDANYFNGTIEFDTEEYHSELKITLIIYREHESDKAGEKQQTNRIKDIVPVWWEYNTCQECGQVPNDFSWSEFSNYLF